MPNLELKAKLVAFVVTFEANESFVLHRHLSLSNTDVIQGERRLYDPRGNLSEVSSLDTYTSSPLGEPQFERSGDSQCVAIYNVSCDVGGQLFQIVDDEKNIAAVLDMEDVKGAYAEQKAA